MKTFVVTLVLLMSACGPPLPTIDMTSPGGSLPIPIAKPPAEEVWSCKDGLCFNQDSTRAVLKSPLWPYVYSERFWRQIRDIRYHRI